MAQPAWWLRARKSSSSRPAGLLLRTVLVALVMALASATPGWHLAEMRIFDYFSTIDPPSVPADAPVIVAIDEPSFSEVGLQWPWPRDLHARLIEALRNAGARAIGLDIIFAEPSKPEADAGLADALGPDVVLAGDESLIETPQADQLVRTEPLPAFTDSGARAGIASIALDGDGVFRTIPAYPDGFATALLAAAGEEPAHGDGRQLIQAMGPARAYPTVSYYQALDPENFLPPGIFNDRIVLVGLSLQNAPTLSDKASDARATPYSVRTGRLVSGVEIQATIYDNLRKGLFVTQAGPLATIGAVLIVAMLGAAIVWKRSDWRTLVVFIAGLVVLGLGSYALLHYGRVFVPPAAPAVAFALVAASQGLVDYAAERRLRLGIVRAFSQYLAPALVEKLVSDPSQLRLGGETRTLSILFCDVRGFTTIAESMRGDLQRLTALINRLLTPLSECILARGGTIDKYIGDAIMAFWNAPLDDADHATHAVEAALDMLAAMDRLNRDLQAEAARTGEMLPPLKIGIGINTGPCVVGNMGSERRFDYSALGDAVNLASRLESASKDVSVPLLIGEATAAALDGRFDAVPLARLTVKGKSETITVSTVLPEASGFDADAHRALLAAGTPDEARQLAGGFAAAEGPLGAYYRTIAEGSLGLPDHPAR